MENLLLINRRQELLSLLQSENSVKVVELAKIFKVSTETIRKDLIYLEARGLLIRGHGGAIAVEPNQDLPLSVKLKTNSIFKSLITKMVYDLIPENSSIYIGPGSTELILAEQLFQKKIRIFTNSIMIAESFYSVSPLNCELLLLGGEIEAISAATVGDMTLSFFNDIYLDYAILGTSGFQKLEGPATFSYNELCIAKKAISRSKKTIVMGDKSKFNMTSHFRYANWEDIDLFVTNTPNNSESILETMKDKVKIVFAD